MTPSRLWYRLLLLSIRVFFCVCGVFLSLTRTEIRRAYARICFSACPLDHFNFFCPISDAQGRAQEKSQVLRTHTHMLMSTGRQERVREPSPCYRPYQRFRSQTRQHKFRLGSSLFVMSSTWGWRGEDPEDNDGAATGGELQRLY